MIDSMHQSWPPRVVAAAFPAEGAPDPLALLQRWQPQVVTAARYWSPARPCPALGERLVPAVWVGVGMGGRPGPGLAPQRLCPFSTCCPRLPLQKLLFSATLTQNPEKLQQLGLHQPWLFSTRPAGGGPRDLEVEADSGGKYTFPAGLSVSWGARVGRAAPGHSGPSQSHAVCHPPPPAPLRALPPALQAAGGPAPDPAPGLLQDPLLHQLPGELPPVRPGASHAGRGVCVGGGAGPSPPAPPLCLPPGSSCWSRLSAG